MSRRNNLEPKKKRKGTNCFFSTFLIKNWTNLLEKNDEKELKTNSVDQKWLL